MILFWKKIGMTSVFNENGKLIPVTAVSFCDESEIVQIKTEETDGYNAYKVGCFPSGKKCNKYKRYTELRIEKLDGGHKVGDKITIDFLSNMSDDSSLKIRANTKGRGFSGGMKRHGFAGLCASHGVSVSHRSIWSTGQSATPGRVIKGKKMPGRYGNTQMSLPNREVVKVFAEDKIVLIKGPLPGSKKGELIFIID